MKYINKHQEFRSAVSGALTDNTHDSLQSWPDQTNEVEVPERLARITQDAINVYLSYRDPGGLIKGNKWWQVANGYTAIALHDSWSKDETNYRKLSASLRRCESSNSNSSNKNGFINDFNDDSLWWALCCLHVYTLRHRSWYLERAEEIWHHVRQSVCERGEHFFQGMDMDGGVFWKSKPPDADHVNSVSTGLFAELSVRLALIQLSSDAEVESSAKSAGPNADEYIDHARRSLGWILRCRYIPQQALVLDHIELKEQKAVDWRFTYNTGITLATCALLYEATGEEEYLLLACHMALKSMTRPIWVEEDGVLTESQAYGRGSNDPEVNDDAVGFKAVLIRGLGVLFDVIRRSGCRIERAVKTRAAIRGFVNVNFRSQQVRNTDGEGVYGPWWDGESLCFAQPRGVTDRMVGMNRY